MVSWRSCDRSQEVTTTDSRTLPGFGGPCINTHPPEDSNELFFHPLPELNRALRCHLHEPPAPPVSVVCSFPPPRVAHIRPGIRSENGRRRFYRRSHSV